MTSKIPVVIFLAVCYKWCKIGEFVIGSISNMLIDAFLYSHQLSAWYFIDIVRKKFWKDFVSDTHENSRINPLSPISDQERISSYTISTVSSRQEMIIKNNMNQGTIGWSNSKFSKLTSYELYARQEGKLPRNEIL